MLLPEAILWLKLLSALWCAIWCSGRLSSSVPGPGCCGERARPSQQEHLQALPWGSREAGRTPSPCRYPALKPRLEDYIPINTNSFPSEGSEWEYPVKRFSLFFLFSPCHLTHSVQYGIMVWGRTVESEMLISNPAYLIMSIPKYFIWINL